MPTSVCPVDSAAARSEIGTLTAVSTDSFQRLSSNPRV
jgi:hypothetical protein